MKQIYKEQLFEKSFLVSDDAGKSENTLAVLFSLAALFNIRVTDGKNLAQEDMIPFVSSQLGIHVPEPFYRGFPKTVRELSTQRLFFDQSFHYFLTYGLDLLQAPGHSIFEDFLVRTAFREDTVIRECAILTEAEAEARIAEIVGNLLLSSRPLNDRQYAVVLEYSRDHGEEELRCSSKSTAVRLLADSRDMRFAASLALSDVIRLVDEINFRSYENEDIKNLNLRNQDRKFIAAVIDRLIDGDNCDITACYEKKAIWAGLLHHIHYRPRNERAARFAACMRGRGNISAWSRFEKAMGEGDIRKALMTLRKEKGAAAVLRSMDYLLSRCSTHEEAAFVLENIRSDNAVVLIQLLLHYAKTSEGTVSRCFRFTRHNRLCVHHETEEERTARRSVLPASYRELAAARIRENLRDVLKGRLGKVYLDADMKRIALPLQENTSEGGVGTLPRGSKIAVERGKKIRAFTYWEKVNDIDLSVIGLSEEGTQTEFSWRTMFMRQSDAISYSGDQTRGYHGGSEYFDLDAEKLKALYPDIRYLVFCDNVYSGTTFSKCFCKAGYMLRDMMDSGEVYEPKTVKSSFLINCDSTFAYLFALDLASNEFIWLNTVKRSSATVAGDTSLLFLMDYFDVTSVINMHSFFAMMASELVDDPAEADVIVSDRAVAHRQDAELIRSFDFDKVLALMNEPKNKGSA